MTLVALTVEVVEQSSLDEEARAAIVTLCSEALRTDCSDLFGFLVSGSTHVCGRLDGRLVGHACWSTRRLIHDRTPLTTAWVDAVTVDPDLQRRGIGSTVMRRLAERTADFDLRALGTERVPFFARLGWEAWAGTVSRVLHDPIDTLMVLRTGTTPTLDLTAAITAAD